MHCEHYMEEVPIGAVWRGEERQRLLGQAAKGQVRAVDISISDESRGVVPLRGRGSDRACSPPFTVWRPWRFIELDGMVVALEAGP